MRITYISGAVLTALVTLVAQKNSSQQATWNKPQEPFLIFGNVYYVGAKGVSSFLITTPRGDFLLDGGFASTAAQIQTNVGKLGFRMQDVHYLLNSHAHYDHCGGLAQLKRVSQASMVASEGDRDTLTSGHQSSFGKGQSATNFPAVKVDRVIHDGDTVSLGDVTLTAHLTAGHTRGCTTWTMPLVDNGKVYHVVFYCSTTVAGNDLVNNRKYPRIVEDYRQSFALLRKLPCDIFLAPHPEFFQIDEKLVKLKAGDRKAFVDPGELKRFVTESEQDFDRELARQTARR